MKSVTLFAICALALVSASGCFLQDQIFGKEGDVTRGLVSFGFEEAAFRPCNSDEQWWIVGDDETIIELQDKWTSLGLEWYQPGYAEIKGERTGKGEYGHVGAYDREVDVKDVLEVRPLRGNECPWPK